MMQNGKTGEGKKCGPVVATGPGPDGLRGFGRDSAATKEKIDRLVAILDAWDAFRGTITPADIESGEGDGKRIIPLSRCHSIAFSLLCGRTFGQADVDRFCLALSRFENDEGFPFKAGIFLSAMVNRGDGAEWTIDTGKIRKPLDHLGAFTSKKVTIRGDAGDFAGEFLVGGELVVEGKAGSRVGADMEDGRIIIRNSAGPEAGAGSKAGRIVIEGGCAGIAADARAVFEHG